MKTRFAAAAAALLFSSAIVAPASAATTTVDFTLLDGASTVANGTFSFDSSKTGQLSYADLDTFSFTLPGGTYDLAFTQSGGFSSYYYFGYNATSQTFVTADVGGFPQILSAIKSSYNSGYFVRNDLINDVRNYGPDSGDVSYTSLVLSSSTSAVPEPTTWALMILGFGAVGGAMRRRQSVAAKIRFA